MATKEELIATAIATLNELNTAETDAYVIGYEAGYAAATQHAAQAAAAIYTFTANQFITSMGAYINTVTTSALQNPINVSTTIYDEIMGHFEESKEIYLNSLTTP